MSLLTSFDESLERQTRDEAGNPFDTVPALIHEHGRVRGFEKMRDVLLSSYHRLGQDNLLAVLKMVIELDRHALMSEVAQAKQRARFEQEAWERFQSYLRGEVDVPGTEKRGSEDAEDDRADAPSEGSRVRLPRRASGRRPGASKGDVRAPDDIVVAREGDGSQPQGDEEGTQVS